MSENSKCPCCGDAISDFPDSGFYECDSCPFICALADLPRIAAAMKAETRHNALVEAVNDERFAEAQLSECWTSDRERSLKSARAEVDRLIANESTSDCEEDG